MSQLIYDYYNNNNNINNNTSSDDSQQSSSTTTTVQTKHLLNYQPTVFTTQKLNNSQSKLSYTPYQLELLNSIYLEMKYPNSVQKTLIAKLIGITRDQVKIWFQNRRRKDTINSQLPTSQQQKKGLKRSFSEEDDENNDPLLNNNNDTLSTKPKVNNQIIESVLNELRNHKNAPSRLSSKRVKLQQHENNDKELLMNAIQVSDSQIIKKTPNNCIIDLYPIINKSPTSIQQQQQSSVIESTIINNTSSSDTDNEIQSSTLLLYNNNNNNNYNIDQNYEQNYQTIQKPYDIQNYLYKKYYSNYYYPQQHQHQQQQQQQQTWPQSTSICNNNNNYIQDTSTTTTTTTINNQYQPINDYYNESQNEQQHHNFNHQYNYYQHQPQYNFSSYNPYSNNNNYVNTVYN